MGFLFAITNVKLSIFRTHLTLSKYVTAKANLRLADETLKQANSQLEIGYATIFDYLVSVDGFIRARTALDEGNYELLASYYGLLHSCGRRE